MELARARTINLLLSGLGCAVFAVLFFYATFAPDRFDRHVHDYVIAQVQGRVSNELNSLSQSQALQRASELAGVFSQDIKDRVDQFKVILQSDINSFVVDILAATCKPGCEGREKARVAVNDFFEKSMARYGVALARIQGLVVGHYQAVMNEVRSDVRIFAGSSFVALLFAFGLSLFHKRAACHLLPISIALTVATVLAAAWYILGQDWVAAIIFNDYWGWGYAVLISTLTFLLADIAANRARITSAIFDMHGGTFAPIGPC